MHKHLFTNSSNRSTYHQRLLEGEVCARVDEGISGMGRVLEWLVGRVRERRSGWRERGIAIVVVENGIGLNDVISGARDQQD